MGISQGSNALYYLQLVIFIIILALIGIQIVPGWSNLTIFLFSSILVVVYAFVNLVCIRAEPPDDTRNFWIKYATLLFIAMILGSIGDFAMPGILLVPTETPLLNGILFFGLGHILYLIALRSLSPLLIKPHEDISINLRNLLVWVLFIIFVLLAFMLTVFDPSQQVLSIGALGYGIILISAVAFAFTKWFDDYPKAYSLSLFLGFVFFFISDWVIAIRNFTDPSFFSGTSFVGVTYLIGQLLIHSTILIEYRLIGMTEDD